MLIVVKCVKCEHQFDVDSAYVGTMRKCPECEHRFHLDDAAAKSDGVNLDELKGRKVACEQCLKSFVPMKVRQWQDLVPCQFCLHEIDTRQGERLHQVVRHVEKTIRKGLILGLEDDVIISMLQEETYKLPDGESSLAWLLQVQTEQLPYVRMKVIQFGSSDTQIVKQRIHCDMCQVQPPSKTLEITWRLTQQSAGSTFWLRVLFGPIGRLLRPVKHHHSSRKGLHFLCSRCVRSVGWWKRFFRMSLVTNGEYVAHAVRTCELQESETGTKITYR